MKIIIGTVCELLWPRNGNEEKKKWVYDRQERRREGTKTDGVVNCLDGQDN